MSAVITNLAAPSALLTRSFHRKDHQVHVGARFISCCTINYSLTHSLTHSLTISETTDDSLPSVIATGTVGLRRKLCDSKILSE